MTVGFSHRVKLHPGSVAGIIALSSPCEPGVFQRGLKHIESLGLHSKVVLDPSRHYGGSAHLFSSDGAVNRARALEDLFLDEGVSFILAVRGAYGSMEVLPELDYALIAQHAKPIIGFSDTTAVLLALYSKSNVPAIHGPSLASAFGKAEESQEARRSAACLLDFLSGALANPFHGLAVDLISGKGEARGPVLGGNLSMLTSLLGTPWEPEYREHLLFIEETGERPYRIHRMLLQLKLAGRLAGLRGVILGSFKNCEHANAQGPSLVEVIRDIFPAQGIPVVGMIPAGHGDWNLPVPIGAEARIGAGYIDLFPAA